MVNFFSKGAVIAALLRNCNALNFPAPSGLYGTSLSTAILVDHNRLDPFAPTEQPRALMVSVFTPVSSSFCNSSVSLYMDPTTAAFEDARLVTYGLPSGIFETLSLQTCQQQPTAHSKHPVILFSPAAGTTRLFYSAMAQQVASTGYVVVMIDHPYDADIVVFPDNTTIFGLNFSDDQIPLAVDTRAQDISFVLDQFALPETKKRFGLSRNLDVSKAGVFGHSLGGAAAAEAMLFDPRLAGGVNLDGTFFGTVVEKGLERPLLIFAHEGKNLTTDPSWKTTWPRLVGWKTELMLAQSVHYTFSDLPDVVAVLGFGGMLSSGVKEVLGSMDGKRAMEIVTTYVESFFDMSLRGQQGRLLEGPNSKYPEATFGGCEV